MAKVFHTYYSDLYNLLTPHKPADLQGMRPQILQDYLTNSRMPKLPMSDKEHLEKPIAEDELYTTIKILKPGKSPGPDGFYS